MSKDFVVLGRIEQIRPDLFFVMVSGVPDGTLSAESAVLRTGSSSTRPQAESLRDRLIRETCEEIISRGDRVIDVDADV